MFFIRAAAQTPPPIFLTPKNSNKMEMEFVENFDGSDNFDDVDNYNEQCETAAAPSRREVGFVGLSKMNSFLGNVPRKAEIAGVNPDVILARMIDNNPAQKNRLKSYVYDSGYEPSSDTYDLAMQVAHARKEQIRDLQDHYDPDNYDSDNFVFGKRKKAERRAKKEVRKTAKKQRVQLRNARKEARLKNKLRSQEQEGARQEEQANADIIAIRGGQSEEGYIAPETVDVYQQTTMQGSPDAQEILQLANPSDEEAHAEIIGAEMEQEGFDEDFDNFLPFLAGALEIGGNAITNAKARGTDFSNVKSLFKKRTQAQKTGGQTGAPLVLNSGIKKIVEKTQQNAALEFVKRNIVWVILGVVIIFIAGRKLKV